MFHSTTVRFLVTDHRSVGFLHVLPSSEISVRTRLSALSVSRGQGHGQAGTRTDGQMGMGLRSEYGSVRREVLSAYVLQFVT
jgi:hypothetical protein